MKKMFIAAVLLTSVSSTFAQTDKGDWLVGGTLGFTTTKGNSNFNLSPSAGYFFADNFAAGANVDLKFGKLGDVKSTEFGIGPFARYYFGKGNLRPFATAAIDYLTNSSKNTTTNFSSSIDGFGWFLGAGGAAFLNQSVALEGIVGFDSKKYSGASANTGFLLKIGFQVYISKSKMQSLKKGKLD